MEIYPRPKIVYRFIDTGGNPIYNSAMPNKPIQFRLPEELKTLVEESLGEGESFADFTREALRRELKRRGTKAKVPTVERGRPRKNQ